MSAIFDPAAWLAEADRIGIDAYVSAGPFDPRLGPDQPIKWMMATGVGDWCEDEQRLFRDLRGDPNTAKRNERALFEHLRAAGRYGGRSWRAAFARWTPAQREDIYLESIRGMLIEAQREAVAQPAEMIRQILPSN